MTKEEAYCRFWAREMWNTRFAEAFLNDKNAQISFEALVSVGIGHGIKAWQEGMRAAEAGNIDVLYVDFGHRII